MAQLQELDTLLQSLQALKPPGVSKSRVDAITKICTTAQLDRSLIIDSIISAFNRAPATHKLGALYVADSVIRQYIAGGNGQGLNNANAIQKLTAHMPSLMDEITRTIPEEQKPRLSKLIDIWLGSKTFSSDMLNAYKQRLSDTPISAPGNTPSIPQQAFDGRASTNYAAAAPVPAPQAPPAVATPTNGYAYAQPPSVATPTSVSMAHQHHVGTPSAVSQAQYAPPVPVAAAIPQSFPGYPPQPPPGMQQYMQQLQAPPQAVAPPPIAAAVAAQNQATVAHNAQAAAAAAPALPALNPAQLAAVQSVVSANPNITAEQLMQILAAMGVPLPAATPQVAAAPVAVSVSQPPPPIPPQPQYDTYSSQRDRSRSPDYKRRRVTPPAKRESPVYGAYDPNAKSERSGGGEYDRRGEQGRGKGSGRDNVRKRSPPRERMASPSIRGVGHAQNPKPFGHDHTLGGGMIRVLSRTLFVGGVSGSANEEQLMDYISRYARVQSCIVNHDKRHAFLKLISHQDAINAKQAMDSRPEAEYRHLFERMNWAVGFGPTKYADYKKGESVLPIDVLTDADRKWMKTAEFGGTGGLEISTGMVVEEPDIEIGAGPSSKAISRRGGKSGFSARNANDNHHGNSSNHASGGGGGGGRRERGAGRNHHNGGGGAGGGYDDHRANGRGGSGYRQDQAPLVETHMPEPVNIGPPPPVPQFGGLPFQLR